MLKATQTSQLWKNLYTNLFLNFFNGFMFEIKVFP